MPGSQLVPQMASQSKSVPEYEQSASYCTHDIHIHSVNVKKTEMIGLTSEITDEVSFG